MQVTDACAAGLLYALEAERAQGYPTGQLFLDNVEAALAALLATSRSKVEPRSMISNGGLAPHRLRRVLEFMRSSVERQITLEGLAACVGLSQSHFLYQFRRSMNVSPQRYMLSLRIDRSKALLKGSNLSVLEIAQATGFKNAQHFATVFRRIVGVSPSYYRGHA